MRWHRKPVARLLLRVAGLALLLLAYAVAHRLLAIGAAHAGAEPPIAYLLAVIGFGCASAGAALLIHGHHLFDTVRVSRRWMIQPDAYPADREHGDS
jgi:hypothetical protein